MNKIKQLKLPSITAEVLQEGVILEPKKGKTLCSGDVLILIGWLNDAIALPNVPAGTQDHGFPLHD